MTQVVLISSLAAPDRLAFPAVLVVSIHQEPEIARMLAKTDSRAPALHTEQTIFYRK